MLVACCAFYLLWWVLAFKPKGAVTGWKSGWLLIPAFALGVAAVVMIIRGAGAVDSERSFFSGRAVLAAAAVAYAALLAATLVLFRRQVTTELVLIVAWAALAAWEGNALYGLGALSRSGSIFFFAAVMLAALASLVCYVLYYGLDARAGYVDGMIPLILAAAFMAALAVLLAVWGARSGTFAG